MQIIDRAVKGFAAFVRNELVDSLVIKIQMVWNHVQMAFHPPKGPPLQMPSHKDGPTSLIYPRKYKREPWPKYLDINWGKGEDSKDIDRIAQLVEPKEKVTPLHAAIINGDDRALFRLIARNPDMVHSEDYRGQTPSYWAAYWGNLSALTILKNFGAHLKHRDNRGKTPLRAAVKYERLGVIDFLVSHGVEINHRDGRGLTPLHLAAYLGKVKAYERLYFYGADESAVDANKLTPKQVLERICQEKYSHRCILRRLFSSPEPSLSLRPYNIRRLAKTRMESTENYLYYN